ncbi:MAG: YabP/YqfC family sporulation protein [Clostridia bacterium]|nr:YabP/YqfC family sporulation protein [Clostridia bacterium]
MKKGIYRIISKLSDKTELPLTDFCREFSATLTGRREVVFDGVLSIVKYETELVVLELCSDLAFIFGENIEIKSFVKGNVCLSGRINKIELCEEKSREQST